MACQFSYWIHYTTFLNPNRWTASNAPELGCIYLYPSAQSGFIFLFVLCPLCPQQWFFSPQLGNMGRKWSKFPRPGTKAIVDSGTRPHFYYVLYIPSKIRKARRNNFNLRLEQAMSLNSSWSSWCDAGWTRTFRNKQEPIISTPLLGSTTGWCSISNESCKLKYLMCKYLGVCPVSVRTFCLVTRPRFIWINWLGTWGTWEFSPIRHIHHHFHHMPRSMIWSNLFWIVSVTSIIDQN